MFSLESLAATLISFPVELLKMAEKLPCPFRIWAFLEGIPKLQDADMRKGPIIGPKIELLITLDKLIR